MAARVSVALLAVIAGTSLLSQEQTAPGAESIALRVDAHRLVATTLLREVTSAQARDDQPTRPAARYGYAHFAVPARWRERPFVEPPLGRWMVHIAPGMTIGATAEEAVGGY